MGSDCSCARSFKVADFEQLGFPLEGMEAAPLKIDQHAVRLELEAILETAKTAQDHAPWDMETYRRLKASFPEKTKALPPDEAEFLRRWFAMEVKRIDGMLAA
jgi:hypothetical protein